MRWWGKILLSGWCALSVVVILAVLPRPPAGIEFFGDDGPGLAALLHRGLLPLYPWGLIAPIVLTVCIRFPLFGRKHLLWKKVALLLCMAAVSITIATWFSGALSKRTTTLMYRAESSPETTENTAGQKDLLAGVLGTAFPQGFGSFTQEEEISIDIYSGTDGLVDGQGALEIPLIMNGEDGKKARVTLRMPLDSGENIRFPETTVRSDRLSMGAAPRTSFQNLLDANRTAGKFVVHLLCFLLLASLANAFALSRAYLEREATRARNLADATEAKLEALQSQLSPHFLFNALNGISSKISEAPSEATGMIASLSDLLRRSLTQQKSQLLPISEELELLDSYLEIQKMRFGGRLRIEQMIDPAVRECLVPPFTLQPLVENAIHHAVEPRPEGGHIEVSAKIINERLLIEVTDDGDPVNYPAKKEGVGIATQNIKKRLLTLFPGTHRFAITPQEGKQGTKSTMEIPVEPRSGKVSAKDSTNEAMEGAFGS